MAKATAAATTSMQMRSTRKIAITKLTMLLLFLLAVLNKRKRSDSFITTYSILGGRIGIVSDAGTRKTLDASFSVLRDVTNVQILGRIPNRKGEVKIGRYRGATQGLAKLESNQSQLINNLKRKSLVFG